MRYAFDDYELDTDVFELRHLGEVVPLARRPLDLLAYLLTHRDRVLLKDELLANVWQGVRVTENALAQAAATLRSALRHTSEPPIVSVRGRGYRFVRPVRTKDDADRESTSSLARVGIGVLHEAATGEEGGFVVRASDALDAALLEMEASGVRVVRVDARSERAFGSFRSFLRTYAIHCPSVCVDDVPLSDWIKDGTDTQKIAELATCVLERAEAPEVVVFDGIDVADVESVLLFSALAARPRKGALVLGACHWAPDVDAGIAARLLARFARDLREEAETRRPSSDVAPRYLGMREMAPLPRSAK